MDPVVKKFNLSKFSSQNNFFCTNCGKATNYKIASSGCPSCKGTLFRVGWSNGTPVAFDPDRPGKDPYKRQKQRNDYVNNGDGQKLVNFLDDGAAGGGERFRGRERPKNYSDLDPDDKNEDPVAKNDLPTEDVIMDDLPGDKYDVSDNFVSDSAEETFSRANKNRRDLEGHDTAGGIGTLDQQLATQRTRTHLSDDKNVFDEFNSRRRTGVYHDHQNN